ncbi:MAG: alpha-ketoacid dehydrogenase subunit beta [Erysipelotrichaceae bacterium]|nr:alpha-ketoacid dehydrogenase subunit beta [Erysipelotrichaceae bacterium]
MNYTLIGKHEKDARDCRDGYANAMLKIMSENDRVLHIDCDLAGCVNATKIKKAYPDRFINAGIAEANAMSMSCGLAATGMIPFMHTFGVFAGRRMFDQAFLSAGYSNWPVHVVGTDPGVTAAINGATHMPFEDGGLYRIVPNAVVLDPCDYAQAYSLTEKLVDCKSLSYMRLIRRGFKTVYADGSDFEIGKGVVLKEGNDATVIASGIMIDNALKAYELLETEDIHVRVIDMFTWKPLDEQLVLKAAEETGAIVSAENHFVGSGLGSAIANLLAERKPTVQEYIGIHNRYGQVGAQEELEKEYGLTAEDIAAAVRKAIERKKM